MQEMAERIGGALGTAVRHARGVPGRVRGGLELVRGRVAERASQATSQVSEASSQYKEQLKDRASEKFADWNDAARRGASQARQQAERIRAEYPLQVMIGLAAAFFVIGFGIRLWRSTRA